MILFLGSLALGFVLGGPARPALTNTVGMQFVLIQAGSMQAAVFQPVCPAAADRAGAPPTAEMVDRRILWTPVEDELCRSLAARDASGGFPVKIDKAFYIGKFEVTQAEWIRVMGDNPSFFQGDRVTDASASHPVDNVSWEDAQQFLRKLNRLEKTRAYRLPTEFEWEYAARACGPGQVGWNDIREQAVEGLRAAAGAGTKPTTHQVGTKKPNAWGLYDMLGNVWEWVADYYNEKTFPDPVAPVRGTQHVLKGGGFLSDVKNVIYSTHGAGPADGWDVGFRVVKDLEQQPK